MNDRTRIGVLVAFLPLVTVVVGAVDTWSPDRVVPRFESAEIDVDSVARARGIAGTSVQAAA